MYNDPEETTVKLCNSAFRFKCLEWGSVHYGLEWEKLPASTATKWVFRVLKVDEPALLRLHGMTQFIDPSPWLEIDEQEEWCLLHLKLQTIRNIRDGAKYARVYSPVHIITGVEMMALDKDEEDVKNKLKELGWENPDTPKRKGP